LAELIRSKARSDGVSVNTTIEKILELSLGVKPRGNDARRGGFEEFCGVWSEADLSEFDERTKEFRTVDSEDRQ
jgi:hypothetical protein